MRNNTSPVFSAVLPSTGDRKSTRLNSSHANISYAVFCLKSEEHTSELQSRQYLVCRLLLEKKKTHGAIIAIVATTDLSYSQLPDKLHSGVLEIVNAVVMRSAINACICAPYTLTAALP